MWRSCVLCLTLLACTGSHDDTGEAPASVYDDPAFDAFAPATLPFTLDPADAVRARGTFYLDAISTYPVREPVVAVAALKDLIAVVYPDADEGRALSVAWTAPGIGWQRQVLEDGRGAIGDVDAISGEGLVHVAVRYDSGQVRYLTWTPAVNPADPGSVTSEDVATTGTGWAVRDCADLSLGVSPEGDIDLIWQGKQELNSGLVMSHGRRQADGQWARHDMLASAYGCGNWLSYDDSGMPYVLTQVRTYIDTAEGFPVNMVDELPNDVVALKWGANEAWQPAGTLVYGIYPSQGSTPEPRAFRGYAWLERHRASGAVFGALAVDEVELGFESFSAGDIFANGYQPPAPFPYRYNCGASCLFEYVGHRSVLGVDQDACGRFRLFYKEEAPVRSIELRTFTDSEAGAYCESPDHAPVLWRPEDALDDLGAERPVFTHGERPYTAAVCVHESGTMALCYGGWGEQLETAWSSTGVREDGPPLMDDAAIPEFRTASIDDGGTVSVDLDTIEVTLSNVDLSVIGGGRADPDAFPVLRDLYWGITYPPVRRSYDQQTGVITMTLQEPLDAAHSYRLELAGGDALGQIAAFQGAGKRRFVHFRAEGDDARRADPREQTQRGLAGCAGRDEGTDLCWVVGFAGESEIRYGEEALRGWPAPGAITVKTDDQRDITSTTTWDWASVGFTVATTEPLVAGGVYTLTLPEVYDHWGVRLTDTTLEARVAAE